MKRRDFFKAIPGLAILAAGLKIPAAPAFMPPKLDLQEMSKLLYAMKAAREEADALAGRDPSKIEVWWANEPTDFDSFCNTRPEWQTDDRGAWEKIAAAAKTRVSKSTDPLYDEWLKSMCSLPPGY